MSVEDAAQQQRIPGEEDGVEQRLSGQTEQDRSVVLEDVSANDDAHQVIVSTRGDCVSAKRITAGVRTSQWLGQMADDTLKQLSQDRGVGSSNYMSFTNGIQLDTQSDAKFEKQHGAGHKLS